MAPLLAQPDVTGVRTGQHGAKTRFVLDVGERIDYRVFLLADPYRVVIDLPELVWRIPDDAGRVGRGLIRSFRYGRFRPGTSRVVLDLARPAGIDRVFLLPPKGKYRYRLVLDLAPLDREAFLAATRKWRPPAPEPVPAPPPVKPSAPDRKPMIVIDAGHGGIDPGTIGRRGTREKVITLATALELRRRLLAGRRYRVVMTRERDVFLRLRERVRIAERAGGDLFISIHADSISDRRVRGATVYTLSEKASDKEAASLAARENKADLIAGIDLKAQTDDVTRILIDLAQRETMNHSAKFAQILVPELAKEIRVQRIGHRFAGFRVLTGLEVPSVLIELGYLSNRRDERMLTSPKRRAAVVQALIRAINRYFTNGRA